MIDTIVLDLDGPLLEGSERHYLCYATILREHGFTPIDKNLYWQMKRNRNDRRKLLALSNALPLYDEFLATWMQRIETQEYLLLDTLQPDVLNILQTWKDSGRTLLLATMRNNPDNLFWQLSHLHIDHFFNAILPVGTTPGSDGKAAKVRAALSDKDLSQVIWVGDTEVDIAAAKELGVPIYAVDCGLRKAEYLSSLAPDCIEHDLRGVAARLQLA